MAAIAARPVRQQQREYEQDSDRPPVYRRGSSQSSADGFVISFPRHNGSGLFAEGEEGYLDVAGPVRSDNSYSTSDMASALTIDDGLSWPASSQRSPVSDRPSLYYNRSPSSARSPSLSSRSQSRGLDRSKGFSEDDQAQRLTASALSRVSSRAQLYPSSNNGGNIAVGRSALPSKKSASPAASVHDSDSMADSIEMGISLAPQAISAGIRPITRRRRYRPAASVKSGLSNNALHILMEDECTSDKENQALSGNEDEVRGRKRRHRANGLSEKGSKRSNTSSSVVGEDTPRKAGVVSASNVPNHRRRSISAMSAPLQARGLLNPREGKSTMMRLLQVDSETQNMIYNSRVGDSQRLSSTTRSEHDSFSALRAHVRSDLDEYPSALYAIAPHHDDDDLQASVLSQRLRGSNSYLASQYSESTRMRRTRSDPETDLTRSVANEGQSGSSIVHGVSPVMIQTALSYWREVLRLLASSPI